MGLFRNKIAWTKVEPLLMYAAMAPTAAKKHALMQRIAEKHNTTPDSLRKRLEWMGMKHVELCMGYAAIDEWERQSKAIAGVMREKDRLQRAIRRKAMNLRNDLHKQEHRAVSVRFACQLFRIPQSLMSAYIHDLKLVTLDMNGKIPLAELRRFYWEDGRWLLKSQRFFNKQRMKK